MAGRRPTPEALKQLAGNPGKRPARKVIRPQGLATCPTWLDKTAREEWKRLASQLELLGLLSSIDQGAFAGYCNAYSMWVRANRVLQRKGFTYDHNGLVKKRPEVGISEAALREMRKYAQEFGMTPSSRSKVSAVAGQLRLPGVPEPPALPNAGADPNTRFFGDSPAGMQ